MTLLLDGSQYRLAVQVVFWLHLKSNDCRQQQRLCSRCHLTLQLALNQRINICSNALFESVKQLNTMLSVG